MKNEAKLITRQEYLNKAKAVLGKEYKSLESTIENEYYNILCDKVKAGETISEKVYNDLTEGQKYHFAKHHNYNGDKINSHEHKRHKICNRP